MRVLLFMGLWRLSSCFVRQSVPQRVTALQYGVESDKFGRRIRLRPNERGTEPPVSDGYSHRPSNKHTNHNNNKFKSKQTDDPNRIQLKVLEEKWDHLYGLAPVRNALVAQRRELQALSNPRSLLPQAHSSPYLFYSKESEILELAESVGVTCVPVDKGILNTLSHNRPHQNVVLRCGKLQFEPFQQPALSSLGLILDQIQDPMNLGALLRTSDYLNIDWVLVCAKNSAPPSAVVSAASAGALERMQIFETSNLPQTLKTLDCQRKIGTAVAPLQDVPLTELPEIAPLDAPAVLVLGSEGQGLRYSVARQCTELVKIPGASAATDSLNVSVSAGILLYTLLQQRVE